MVNINVLKRFETEFKEILDETVDNKNREFKISGIVAIDRKKSSVDLSCLVSCSNNYYEDLIKIYSQNEFVFNVLKDVKISFAGKGILYLIVENDVNLELEFISKRFNACYIKVLVKEGVNLNSVIYSDCNSGWNNIEFILEQNANLNLSEIIFGSKLFHVNVSLQENAKYDLKSSYFLKESNCYILNKVIHLGENSISSIDVKGAAIENSKVISEGFVNISRLAKKSIANQNLKGLILDNASSISGEPILEINNSDVKCSHGFSVSQISNEIIFYMNSRGISKRDAIWLVLEGFFNYALEHQDQKLIEKYLKLIEKKF